MVQVTTIITGDIKTARLFRVLQTEIPKASNQIARELAKAVVKEAKRLAPRDTGNLRRAIDWRKITHNDRKTEYRVFLHRIKGHQSDEDPGGKSSKSQNVYPIAQEHGYRPHTIKRGWANPASKLRAGGHSRDGIMVSKFTPYMLPAKLKVEGKSAAVASRIIRRVIKRAQK